MKKLFQGIPIPLRMPLFMRAAVGAVAMILFAAIWVCSKEFTFAFPCLVLAVFLFVNSAVMIYNIIMGNYVCLHGLCIAVERTLFRKRFKTITVMIEDKQVMFPIRLCFQKPSVGKVMLFYISDKAPVYEKEGGYYLNSYYALALDKEVDDRAD